MADAGEGRLIQAEKSRTLIYVSQRVASDSTFPFAAGDKLFIKIDAKRNRLIIEHADPPEE